MLSRLPPEVSLDIFGLLELRHLARCLRVCREWHHFLIKAPSLWNHLNLRRHLVSGLDATTFETYQYALKNYIMWAGSHLKTLRLDFELSEVYGTLALQLVATHGCKRLERLELNNTAGPEETLLMLRALRSMGTITSLTFLQLYCLNMTLYDIDTILFTNFPNLQYLDLSDSCIHDTSYYHHHNKNTMATTTNIRELTLSNIERGSSSVFEYLLRSCPKLERLNCYNAIPSYHIIQLLSQYHASLTTLGFGYRPNNHRGEGGGAPERVHPPLTTAVRSISLRRVTDIAFTGVVFYGSCTTLTSLHLHACNISDECIRRLAENNNNLSTFPQLKQLHLIMVNDLTEFGLDELLLACTPRLEQLVIKRAPDMILSDHTLDTFSLVASLVDITYDQPDQVSPMAIRRLVTDKHILLNRVGTFCKLHLAFNYHTRLTVHFPTQMSVDALLQTSSSSL